jgi:hypothetical protein
MCVELFVYETDAVVKRQTPGVISSSHRLDEGSRLPQLISQEEWTVFAICVPNIVNVSPYGMSNMVCVVSQVTRPSAFDFSLLIFAPEAFS